MRIDYEKWREGVPYDLDALNELTADERRDVETLLISRKNEDWRDTQALARLGSSAALKAIEESTRGPNYSVRLAAGEYLHSIGRLQDLSPLIVKALKKAKLGGGLAEAERLASLYPSESVKDALFDGALRSSDDRAVRFVGILYYLFGKATEPFDWSQRPFFLKFLAEEPSERRKVFEEMCKTLGVNSGKWTGA